MSYKRKGYSAHCNSLVQRFNENHGQDTIEDWYSYFTPEWPIQGDSNKRSKRVVDINSGKVYDSIQHAAQVFKINNGTLEAMLRGQNPNKTSLRKL